MPLCIPRKRHECRVCGQWIQPGELCSRWSGVEQGEGWFTSHAHPICGRFMQRNWRYDWEIIEPGDYGRSHVEKWEYSLLMGRKEAA